MLSKFRRKKKYHLILPYQKLCEMWMNLIRWCLSLHSKPHGFRVSDKRMRCWIQAISLVIIISTSVYVFSAERSVSHALICIILVNLFESMLKLCNGNESVYEKNNYLFMLSEWVKKKCSKSRRKTMVNKLSITIVNLNEINYYI